MTDLSFFDHLLIAIIPATTAAGIAIIFKLHKGACDQLRSLQEQLGEQDARSIRQSNSILQIAQAMDDADKTHHDQTSPKLESRIDKALKGPDGKY